MVDRTAIINTAKYLRNIRPIDPKEVTEYVEGKPHPAVIRQVLLEEAPALGVIEQPDGTFVPASEDPVIPREEPVREFPEAYATIIEEHLVESYGYDWATGDSGSALRDRIRELKEAYVKQEPVEYDYEVALGYALYHLPSYYATIQYVLEDLIETGSVPSSIRVFDVGAGVGGPALGITDRLPGDGLVEYHALEPSGATKILADMLEATGPNVHAQIHPERAQDHEIEGTYDLILFGNVLNELENPTAVLDRYTAALATDGSLLLLEPADPNTCGVLREVERHLVDAPDRELTVYSPTIRLWPGERPTDAGWSFRVEPDIKAPAVQRRLDEAGGGSGEFTKTSVQFAYAIVRADGKRRIDVTPDAGRFMPLSRSESAISERVDILAIKQSHNLTEEGNPLFRLGDGSQSVDHFAVVPKQTRLNEPLLSADYGDLLQIENGLVLWNDDEEAINVVVDDESIIERIKAPVGQT